MKMKPMPMMVSTLFLLAVIFMSSYFLLCWTYSASNCHDANDDAFYDEAHDATKYGNENGHDDVSG